MDIGIVVIHASIGVSIEACGAGLPAPMCKQIAMSCSTSVLYIGSQYGLWMLGKPWIVGFSLSDTAVQPFFAIRLISSIVAFMSHVGSNAHGMKRPGCEPHHSSMCQSL